MPTRAENERKSPPCEFAEKAFAAPPDQGVSDARCRADDSPTIKPEHGGSLCGSDLQLRRKIDQVVYEARVQLAGILNELADQVGEPPLTPALTTDSTEEDGYGNRPGAVAPAGRAVVADGDRTDRCYTIRALQRRPQHT